MKTNEIKEKLLGAIRHVQKLSGEDGKVADDTCLNGDLNFDSLRTVETSIYAAEALDCDYNRTLDLFLPLPGQMDVQVGEVVQRACELLGGKEENDNG